MKTQCLPKFGFLPTFARVALAAAVLVGAVNAEASGVVDVPGARIVGQSPLTVRTVALTIQSAAFSTDTTVEVILPAGYFSDNARRWPVIYYLAGTSHTESTFRDQYGGESLTADAGAIVVVPRGDAGYWSDWFNLGPGGPPQYETFVASQLIPLIDANFRTKADRAHRSVLGESMGGYGALMIAARHPDLFVAVASLSGAVDTNFVPGTLVLDVSPVLMRQPPAAVYGPRLTEEVRWRGHNPVDIATNLRAMKVQVFSGNGVLDVMQGETLAEAAGCGIEAAVLVENTTLHNVLAASGISHTWRPYSWGCHGVALFKQEIRDALPGLMAAFGTRRPDVFSYRSITPAFTVFGWSVAADSQRAIEFFDLTNVSRGGLSLAGSGTVSLTTPPLFEPGHAVRVVAGGLETTEVAAATGVLSFTVNLGAANSEQQYRLGSTTAVATVDVRLIDN